MQTRVLVLGLDCLSPDLVGEWSAAGHLPNLKSLIDSGAFCPLGSTPHYSSGPAWMTFATGANPGKHGIYAFMRRKRGAYEMEVSNFTQCPIPTMWEIISDAGGRSAVLNVPTVFPAPRINGAAISGWLCPSLAHPGAVWPRDLREDLRQHAASYPFQTDIKRHRYAGRYETAFRNVKDAIETKTAVAQSLLKKGPWDLFTFVLVEGDAAQHHFWHLHDPEAEEYDSALQSQHGDLVLETYKLLDESVGKVLASAGDVDMVIVMSDHGAMLERACFGFVRPALEKMGLLRPRRSPAATLARRGFLTLNTVLPKSIKSLLSDRFSGLRSKVQAVGGLNDVRLSKSQVSTYYPEEHPSPSSAGIGFRSSGPITRTVYSSAPAGGSRPRMSALGARSRTSAPLC